MLNIIYAGHYAMETVGVKALGKGLTEKFNLEVQFLDFPTDLWSKWYNFDNG